MKLSNLLNRGEFVKMICERTGRKPATVEQCIYTHGFKPAERRAGEGRFQHMLKPYYTARQVDEVVHLVLRDAA